VSNVYFISDLHLGHEGALKWARDFREGKDIHEHDQILMDKINSVVTKRDTLYVLGDVTFRNNHLFYMHQIPCRMILVRGNHDNLSTKEYLSVFDEVHGLIKYKGFWLSHAPIHPHELRGSKNIHGHVHIHGVMNKPRQGTDVLPPEIARDMWDRNYISVCAEAYNGYPIPFQDIIDQSYWNKRLV
jgi:calcineurin-like phosphoesterase family protein